MAQSRSDARIEALRDQLGETLFLRFIASLQATERDRKSPPSHATPPQVSSTVDRSVLRASLCSNERPVRLLRWQHCVLGSSESCEGREAPSFQAPVARRLVSLR